MVANFTYLSLTIQLNISHLFNDQTVQFQTIQLSIIYLFAFSLDVAQFYLIHR